MRCVHITAAKVHVTVHFRSSESRLYKKLCKKIGKDFLCWAEFRGSEQGRDRLTIIRVEAVPNASQ